MRIKYKGISRAVDNKRRIILPEDILKEAGYPKSVEILCGIADGKTVIILKPIIKEEIKDEK